MLFHTSPFFYFLLVVLSLFFILPASLVTSMLVIVSYVFYGWSEPKFVFLMIGSSVVDFYVAQYFLRFPDRKTRNIGIWLSACFNFGLLAYFKYMNFAIENVQALLEQLGVSVSIHTLQVALPVGISFYTFHTFSYSFDVLREKILPCTSLKQFLLFVGWFPQLVAGPIARGETLIPELNKIGPRRREIIERIPEAVLLFAEGWIRKACADWLALVANPIFNDGGWERQSTTNIIYGIVAFGLQIYGDFSGYTRMAQGISWLFGVRLTENFNLPYIARAPQDFWRRWHISLSTWFRDYFYIPLGGNRCGPFRTNLNLTLTFLVCGFWHGAGWNFIVWGALHATYLVMERLGRNYWSKVPSFFAIPIMWVLVFLAWVPFRAKDLGSAKQIFTALGNGGWSPVPLELWIGALGIIACDCVVAFSRQPVSSLNLTLPRLSHRQLNYGVPLFVVSMLGLWFVNKLFWQARELGFIYFQF